MANEPKGDQHLTAVCPWCSAANAEDAIHCSACGASLIADAEQDVPGVTTLAARPVVTAKATSQPRNRILSWISGEYPGDIPTKAEVQAIAPPDEEVRREMRRLELEAEVARLQAEANAIQADAVEAERIVEASEVAEPGDAGTPAEDGPEPGDAPLTEERPPA